MSKSDRLFPPNNSGWYQYLFNQMLVNGEPDFASNRLAIVTFNYDRSLEAYIHEVLQNRFLLNQNEASDLLQAIPIVHVHGILGKYPGVEYRPADNDAELVAISEGIQIIHEIEDRAEGFCNDAFRMANTYLQQAERIFFLGFGFHRDNLRRFEFFGKKDTSKIEIRATTLGLHNLDLERLTHRLAEFGIPADACPANSTDCERFFSQTAYLK